MFAMMRDFKDSIKLIVIFGTLFLNALLIYQLLAIPLETLFQDEGQPYAISQRPNSILQYTENAIIALLVASSFFMLWKIYKTEKIFLYAPLFSLTVLMGLPFAYYYSNSPTTTEEYVKDGYYYKTEVWKNKLHHTQTFKRWKSKLLYDNTVNVDKMQYLLDSSSISREK